MLPGRGVCSLSAMAQESKEHQEWREETERDTLRFQRITTTAERLLLAHDIDPDVAIGRARTFVDAIDDLAPEVEDEPPFSDEVPPPPAKPTAAGMPPTPNASPAPTGQGMAAGFFPTR